MRLPITLPLLLILLLGSFLISHPVQAEEARRTEHQACGKDFAESDNIVWYGSRSELSFKRLAAYVAPILALSADEPLLYGSSGPDIRIPNAFPFEEPNKKKPVVYYRIRDVLTDKKDGDNAVTMDPADINDSILHLAAINGIKLEFFFYYDKDIGVGGHPHDIESTKFKLEVIKNKNATSPRCQYLIRINKILATSHGVTWYNNALFLDEDDHVSLPITIFVEEGKHASAQDRNADGQYSPGYDVNRRMNDAWGVRDVIRTGTLSTGAYQAWMTKPRHTDFLVLPPLPKDSPLYQNFSKDRRKFSKQPVYELRPFPEADQAGDDKGLHKKIAEKGEGEWPDIVDTGTEKLGKWIKDEKFTRSFGVAFRYDGRPGIAFYVPLLIVKNVELPVVGGWLVNRVYLSDSLRDIGYNLLYTRSASRWVGGYAAAGVEFDKRDSAPSRTLFVFEGGIKFRFNLSNTFMGPITKITTPFWGFRFGVRNRGFPNVNQITYVIEVGAGVW